MPDIVVALLALLVCAAPGAAVLAALGVRDPVAHLALAVPATVGVAGVTAVVVRVLGAGFGITAVAAVTAAAVVVAVARAVVRRSVPDGRTGLDEPTVPRGIRRVVPSRTGRPAVGAVVAAGWLVALGGTALGVLTWWRGMGGLRTVPQEHDTIVHSLLTSYIARTGRAAPWELLPLDVVGGTPVSFYPAGMHLLAALLTDVTGDAVTGLDGVTLVLLGALPSVSAAVLGHVAARRLRLSPGSAALVAGTAALVAAGLYRPAVQLAHDGGALPNAVALAMAPGLVAALLLLPRLGWPLAAATGVAAAGAVWVHPSAAVSVGLTAIAWWVGDAFVASGRRELRVLWRRLPVAGAVAAVLLVPFLVPAASMAARTSGFPADSAPFGISSAVGSTLGLAYGGYLDPQRLTGQPWPALLTLVGAAAVLVLRRGYGPFAAWAVWVAVTTAYFLSPSTGIETAVTGFFYKALARVWSHVSLLVPVLAGLGVVVLVSRVAVVLRRATATRTPVRVDVRWLVPAVVLLVVAGYALVPARGYASVNVGALGSRYAEPHFVRVGPDDVAAAAWLADHVRPGERVLNSPNDGSTHLYVAHGIPIVNVYPLGLTQADYSWELLERFDSYPRDPEIRRMLDDLDVAWVYVDGRAPVIGAAGSPQDWAGAGTFDLAPGFADLDGLPGLTEAFASGSVRIYRLDLGASASSDR